MNILMLSKTDPAGTAIIFKKAIEKHTDHTCRLITKNVKYNFNFDTDIHLPDGFDEGEIEQLLKDADILHFHILSTEDMEIGPFKVKDYIKGKKIIHHHHGSPDFRSNPDKYRIRYRKQGRKALVSTPDLLFGLPSAHWMPNIIPLYDKDYMPSDNLYLEPTIGQSPTRTELKDTVYLLEEAHRIGAKVDIIMNTEHRQCLRRKQKCSVIFDHRAGYYGMSSLEGLSMGKRVIAKLSDWVSVNIKIFTGAETLPWDDKIEPVQVNPYARDWMKRFWSEKIIINRLIKFYETL